MSKRERHLCLVIIIYFWTSNFCRVNRNRSRDFAQALWRDILRGQRHL